MSEAEVCLNCLIALSVHGSSASHSLLLQPLGVSQGTVADHGGRGDFELASVSVDDFLFGYLLVPWTSGVFVHIAGGASASASAHLLIRYSLCCWRRPEGGPPGTRTSNTLFWSLAFSLVPGYIHFDVGHRLLCCVYFCWDIFLCGRFTCAMVITPRGHSRSALGRC